ncbi:fatty acid retinoid binding protein (Gp-FAR-1) [Streptomyces sp. DvalAA-19]|nr:fatty acid retinoid binding protein (Gp-FAR-1) [Streptomyces sp. DvalAA-19]
MPRTPAATAARTSIALAVLTAAALSATAPLASAHAAPPSSSPSARAHAGLPATGSAGPAATGVAGGERARPALVQAALPRVLAGVAALDEPVLGLVSLLESGERLSELARTLPLEVSTFYLWLTDEDKAVLKEIASHAGAYANEDELLEALKEKSPRLYEKAVELRDLVKAKIESLTPEAKTFVASVIEKVRSLKPKADEELDPEKVRETVQATVEQFRALSAEAKSDLARAFPILTSLFVLPASPGAGSAQVR